MKITTPEQAREAGRNIKNSEQYRAISQILVENANNRNNSYAEEKEARALSDAFKDGVAETGKFNHMLFGYKYANIYTSEYLEKVKQQILDMEPDADSIIKQATAYDYREEYYGSLEHSQVSLDGSLPWVIQAMDRAEVMGYTHLNGIRAEEVFSRKGVIQGALQGEDVTDKDYEGWIRPLSVVYLDFTNDRSEHYTPVLANRGKQWNKYPTLNALKRQEKATVEAIKRLASQIQDKFGDRLAAMKTDNEKYPDGMFVSTDYNGLANDSKEEMSLGLAAYLISTYDTYDLDESTEKWLNADISEAEKLHVAPQDIVQFVGMCETITTIDGRDLSVKDMTKALGEALATEVMTGNGVTVTDLYKVWAGTMIPVSATDRDVSGSGLWFEVMDAGSDRKSEALAAVAEKYGLEHTFPGLDGYCIPLYESRNMAINRASKFIAYYAADYGRQLSNVQFLRENAGKMDFTKYGPIDQNMLLSDIAENGTPDDLAAYLTSRKKGRPEPESIKEIFEAIKDEKTCEYLSGMRGSDVVAISHAIGHFKDAGLTDEEVSDAKTKIFSKIAFLGYGQRDNVRDGYGWIGQTKLQNLLYGIKDDRNAIEKITEAEPDRFREAVLDTRMEQLRKEMSSLEEKYAQEDGIPTIDDIPDLIRHEKDRNIFNETIHDEEIQDRNIPYEPVKEPAMRDIVNKMMQAEAEKKDVIQAARGIIDINLEFRNEIYDRMDDREINGITWMAQLGFKAVEDFCNNRESELSLAIKNELLPEASDEKDIKELHDIADMYKYNHDTRSDLPEELPGAGYWDIERRGNEIREEKAAKEKKLAEKETGHLCSVPLSERKESARQYMSKNKTGNDKDRDVRQNSKDGR